GYDRDLPRRDGLEDPRRHVPLRIAPGAWEALALCRPQDSEAHIAPRPVRSGRTTGRTHRQGSVGPAARHLLHGGNESAGCPRALHGGRSPFRGAEPLPLAYPTRLRVARWG